MKFHWMDQNSIIFQISPFLLPSSNAFNYPFQTRKTDTNNVCTDVFVRRVKLRFLPFERRHRFNWPVVRVTCFRRRHITGEIDSPSTGREVIFIKTKLK